MQCPMIITPINKQTPRLSPLTNILIQTAINSNFSSLSLSLPHSPMPTRHSQLSKLIKEDKDERLGFFKQIKAARVLP